ncbi:hypothetical protein GCM10019060_17220 [Novosphingobium pokkalii]|nr:hypothetical protein GCM10019060_17220 [Novosphingobium pokkalii]
MTRRFAGAMALCMRDFPRDAGSIGRVKALSFAGVVRPGRAAAIGRVENRWCGTLPADGRKLLLHRKIGCNPRQGHVRAGAVTMQCDYGPARLWTVLITL